MRRAHGHLAFGLVAAALGLVILGEGERLGHAQRVNAAVAEWAERAAQLAKDTPAATQAAATDAKAIADTQAASDAGITPSSSAALAKWTAVASTNPLPEARLARAVALSKVDYDGALGAYKAIVQSDREDLRRIALYDLGNLHLRQALQAGLTDETQSLPLAELAKQSYRELLRTDPNDWDARYNLERALRLAPEEDDDSDDTGPPDPREHERSTIADPRMDLP